MNTIDEKTKLPLSIILGILGSVIAFAVFAASLNAKVEEHEKSDDARVMSLQQRQDKTFEFIRSVDERLSRIEGKLGVRSHD